MKSIAILTPSYRPDFHRLLELHQSILELTDDSVVHHVIVPQRDYELLRPLESRRLRIWVESEFMPNGFFATDGLAAFVQRSKVLPSMLRFSAINARHPWPPVRGWMLQQILKLSAAPRLGVDGVVVVDSDVVLVRRMDAGLFFRGDFVRFYEKPAGITPDMNRHVKWTHTAHKLLGLAEPENDSISDYIAGIVSWDPTLVTSCLYRIQEATGMAWATAIASQLHFSEFVLYGTYVRNFGRPEHRSYTENSALCHSYWEPRPMDDSRVGDFIDSFGASDLAVHIQSNSSTSASARARILSKLHDESRS